MPKLPVFKGKELIKFFEYLGFQVTRTKGSHSRLKSEMSLEEFTELYSKYRGNK